MKNKINTLAIFISFVMLLLSVPPLFPYGYYILLRWVICGTASYFAYLSRRLNKKSWKRIMIVIALLFNPFLPVHLQRVNRVLVDTIVACLFIASLIKFKKDVKESILNVNLVKTVVIILFFAIVISVISYCYFIIKQEYTP